MAGKDRRHGAQRIAKELGTAPTPGTRWPRPPLRLWPWRREPNGERGQRRRQAQDGRRQGGNDTRRSTGTSRGGGEKDDAGHSPAQTPVAAQAASEGD